MNLRDSKYKDFALVREMLETPAIVEKFDFFAARDAAELVRRTGKLFLTGEGSSRIFPAKNMICSVLVAGVPLAVCSEGARQAHEYQLADFVVFGASNSGRTKELISLFTQLGSRATTAGWASAHSPCTLETVANRCYTLRCGKEDAVAATKSVVEQALFYRSLLVPGENGLAHAGQSAAGRRRGAGGVGGRVAAGGGRKDRGGPGGLLRRPQQRRGRGADAQDQRDHPQEKRLPGRDLCGPRHRGDHAARRSRGGHRSISGRDRKVPDHAGRWRGHDRAGRGRRRRRSFPTIRIPRVEGYQTVLELLAGWNILVQVGVALGINLDKAERARKIGNEFISA